MKKKFFVIILFLFTISCGFSPIYNASDLKDVNINVAKYSGDKDLNKLFSFNLKKYNKPEIENIFNLNISTNYSKIVLSKNKSGSPENYNLILSVKFEVSKQKFNKLITFNETIELKNNDNKYEENTYERIVKENFTRNAIQKLILELHQIKNDI